MNIAYQGVPGSFSHITAQTYFGSDHFFIGTKEFKEIFEHIKAGTADCAVVPVENTVAGSIYDNYDHLYTYDVHVIGEHNLKVAHFLQGIKTEETGEDRLKQVTKVYSHIKALEQCEDFLGKHPWMEKVIFSDTAGASQMVAEKNDPSCAAVASSKAAEIYNLDILASNIEDNHENFTRFLILARQPLESDIANKCSLILTLPHQPGSLYDALSIFAAEKINLTKIESRPILGKPFEYIFYLDLEFPKENLRKMKDLLEHTFKPKTTTLKILGFYNSQLLEAPLLQ